MPNEKQRRNFSDVHKRQLFHWIGADIDEGLRRRKLTVEKARETYLRYLLDDVRNGLPIKRPRVPERLACGRVSMPLELPVACFTEWALSESRPHSSRYGRMAFGFSKPWIISHGGQPVAYFNHIQKGLFLKDALGLFHFLDALKTGPCPDGFHAREIEAAFEHARYVLHFAKPFASPRAKPKPKHRIPAAGVKPAAVKHLVRRRPATRYYGHVLDFLEEREWRIVRHNKPYFVKDPKGRFDSRLRFELGTELFTLVLPDNELVKMVWSNKYLRDRLLEADVPVSILSFQDIGTF